MAADEEGTLAQLKATAALSWTQKSPRTVVGS
jgi:hypothetical protein